MSSRSAPYCMQQTIAGGTLSRLALGAASRPAAAASRPAAQQGPLGNSPNAPPVSCAACGMTAAPCAAMFAGSRSALLTPGRHLIMRTWLPTLQAAGIGEDGGLVGLLPDRCCLLGADWRCAWLMQAGASQECLPWCTTTHPPAACTLCPCWRRAVYGLEAGQQAWQPRAGTSAYSNITGARREAVNAKCTRCCKAPHKRGKGSAALSLVCRLFRMRSAPCQPALSSPAPPADVQGHGTHTAGLVGAAGNNVLGVAGVNWRVSLYICKAAHLG